VEVIETSPPKDMGRIFLLLAITSLTDKKRKPFGYRIEEGGFPEENKAGGKTPWVKFFYSLQP